MKEMHQLITSLVENVDGIDSSHTAKSFDKNISTSWHQNISCLKNNKSWYELGISYQSIGCMKIGLAPVLKQVSYWDTSTVSIFDGFACLILASMYYKYAGKKLESHLVAKKLLNILQAINEQNSIDEQMLVGLRWELMGDCCLLLGDSSGINSYEKALKKYDSLEKQDESIQSTWEVQEEFASVDLVFNEKAEQLAAYVNSLLHYNDRIQKKIKLADKLNKS